MNLDYETLRLIFWLIQVFCLICFILSEGILSGFCMLIPLLGADSNKTETVLSTLKPHLMTLQIWLIISIIMLFAVWPIVYSVFFSSFHLLLIFMLAAWALRPLAWHIGPEHTNVYLQQYKPHILSSGGWLITILLGLIAGNLLKGIPFHLDSDMRILFLGNLSSLFNPFSLLTAGVCVALVIMYGASFLQMQFADQSTNYVSWIYKSGIVFILLFTVSGLWIGHLEGYHITSDILPQYSSNPLNKFVKRGDGLWLDNYEHLPELIIIPALAALCGAGTLILTKLNYPYWAFINSTVSVLMTTLTVAVSMFPFLLPSNLSLNSSLTIWDSGSSLANLNTLLILCIPAIPIIAILVRWSMHSFKVALR